MEEIKLNLENLSEPEREQLMALVKKANEPKSKVWKPSKDDAYYYVLSDGTVVYTLPDAPRGAQGKIKLGNCFPTKEEAEEAVLRQQMLTEWKRLSIEAGEEENPWNGKSKHWYVFYWCGENSLRYSHVCLGRWGAISFPTKEACMNAVQVLGEENVKKYILGINE